MSLPEAEARDPTVSQPLHELVLDKAEREAEHVEDKDGNVIEPEAKAGAGLDVPLSPFRDMPRRRAIRVFWKVCLFSFLVAWTAIMDGFLITSQYLLTVLCMHETEVTVPGSIVANKYFIKQFCTVTVKGECALDPRYVGGFTGVQSVGQIIGMLVSCLQRFQHCVPRLSHDSLAHSSRTVLAAKPTLPS